MMPIKNPLFTNDIKPMCHFGPTKKFTVVNKIADFYNLNLGDVPLLVDFMGIPSYFRVPFVAPQKPKPIGLAILKHSRAFLRSIIDTSLVDKSEGVQNL